MSSTQPAPKRQKVNNPDSKADKEWCILGSDIAQATLNPIREVVDKIKFPPPDPAKPIIKLSLGDPCVFGNLNPPKEVMDAVVDALQGTGGYVPSVGTKEAREAIAAKFSPTAHPITAGDVVIASGGSGAVVLAIQALASKGDNILIPRPGFALYLTIAGHCGIESRYYDCLPDSSWEIDLVSLEKQVDKRTKAIVLNNPSNPCGTNYSKQHLLVILTLAEKHRLPIISDEIYDHMVYPGQMFHPLAELSNEVPILTIGGLAKNYCVPGWRVGWLCIHDRKGRFGNEIKDALLRLTFLTLGSCTAIQAAIPRILAIPSSWTDTYMGIISTSGKYLINRIQRIPGLRAIEPQGALYLMVQIRAGSFQGIEDDRDFTQKLLEEEQVMVLPGSCFALPGFFRLVCCAPVPILKDAMDRLNTFCARYSSPTS
eukprot:gb/GEZN01009125.1/.p1 GENE.gb/GEZN01009125.1/~~gb/GEZN01009125.1/.p1  ORF type:complete len:435 (-),score=67.53 gb/GEZN01009125.1/:51-1334(-)